MLLATASMATWTNVSKNSASFSNIAKTTGVSEIDYFFQDGDTYTFQDAVAYVFREASGTTN